MRLQQSKVQQVSVLGTVGTGVLGALGVARLLCITIFGNVEPRPHNEVV